MKRQLHFRVMHGLMTLALGLVSLTAQAEITIGSRIAKSPYYPGTVAAGATHYTIYNRMYMPTSYGDPGAGGQHDEHSIDTPTPVVRIV